MIRWHLGVFWGATIIAVLWSAQVVVTHLVRLDNQPILHMIRNGKKVPNHREVAASIGAYQSALKYAPCNALLHADLALLAAYKADSAMAAPALNLEDAALEAMQQVLVSYLGCTPRDGKVWLDLAMLDVVRQGATPRTLMAYRMSALAAPGEAWLAKKRLEFAITFLPIFSAKELAVVRADLAVLERAHPNNMMALQAAAQVKNKRALYTLFGTTAPVDTP